MHSTSSTTSSNTQYEARGRLLRLDTNHSWQTATEPERFVHRSANYFHVLPATPSSCVLCMLCVCVACNEIWKRLSATCLPGKEEVTRRQWMHSERRRRHHWNNRVRACCRLGLFRVTILIAHAATATKKQTRSLLWKFQGVWIYRRNPSLEGWLSLKIPSAFCQNESEATIQTACSAATILTVVRFWGPHSSKESRDGVSSPPEPHCVRTFRLIWPPEGLRSAGLECRFSAVDHFSFLTPRVSPLVPATRSITRTDNVCSRHSLTFDTQARKEKKNRFTV